MLIFKSMLKIKNVLNEKFSLTIRHSNYAWLCSK